KLLNFIIAAGRVNPDINLEDFTHKAQRLQEDNKVDSFVLISIARVTATAPRKLPSGTRMYHGPPPKRIPYSLSHH
ncbi:hypothetical protein EDD22DRAFT_783853, partial [Suillus occidentalis]